MAENGKPTTKFHLLKSETYREIPVDGAFGGPTPQGRLFVAFYAERQPTPKVIFHEMEDTGRLGRELTDKREALDGFVREIQVGAYISTSAARSIGEWLIKHADALDKKVKSDG